MKISDLIFKLMRIETEYGDIDCYINNSKPDNVVRLDKDLIRYGSACALIEPKDFGIKDGSDFILYLGN